MARTAFSGIISDQNAVKTPMASPTNSQPQRRWRRIAWGGTAIVAITAAVLVIAFCLRRGDGLERRLMRVGGRMVQAAAQRPRRTAIAFATLLGVSWTGLAIAAWMQRSPAERRG
jgi:hypothetical protein